MIFDGRRNLEWISIGVLGMATSDLAGGELTPQPLGRTVLERARLVEGIVIAIRRAGQEILSHKDLALRDYGGWAGGVLFLVAERNTAIGKGVAEQRPEKSGEKHHDHG